MGRLPADMENKTITFLVVDDRVHVYLVSYEKNEVKSPSSPLLGPSSYRDQLVKEIYPDSKEICRREFDWGRGRVACWRNGPRVRPTHGHCALGAGQIAHRQNQDPRRHNSRQVGRACPVIRRLAARGETSS